VAAEILALRASCVRQRLDLRVDGNTAAFASAPLAAGGSGVAVLFRHQVEG
jgi:hypothetical protein